MNSNEPNVIPNASQWNMVNVGPARVGLAVGMKSTCRLSHFCSLWVHNANVVSRGIWALDYMENHRK